MERRVRLFERFARVLVNHPRVITLVSVSLVAASVVWLSLGKLGINASRSSVIDPNDPEQQLFFGYLERFGSAHDIVVLLEGPDLDGLHKAADSVAAELAKEPLVTSTFYKVDLTGMAASAPWYMPLSEMKRLRSGLELAKKVSGGNTATTAVAGIADLVKRTADGLETFAEDGELPSGVPKDEVDSLPVKELATLMGDRLRELEASLVDGKRPFAYDGLFSNTDARVGLDRDGYLSVLQKPSDAPGHAMLIQVRSDEDVVDEKVALPLAAAVRTAADRVSVGGIKSWVTGVPVLFAEERVTLTRDLAQAGLLATFATILIFLVAYRSLWFCLIAFVPVLAGTAVALAIVSFIYGSLGLVSSIIAVTLVGIGSDFAVHLLSRFQVERAAGGTYADVTARTMVGAGPPVLMGAITSISSFVAMALTDFRATQELGVISALGLFIVLVATFVLLPMLERRRTLKPLATLDADNSSGWTWPSKIDIPVMSVLLVITIVLAAAIRPIEFNFDSKAFLPEGSAPVIALNRLTDYKLGELDYAVTQAPTLEQSIAQRDAVLALGPDVVARVESIADVVPAEAAAKASEVAAIRRAAQALPTLELTIPPSVDAKAFRADLQRLASAFANDLPFTLRTLGMDKLSGELEPVKEALASLAKRTATIDDALLAQRLQRLDTDLKAAFGAVRPFFDLPPERAFSLSDLPRDFTSRFYQPATATAPTTFAVRIYPAHPPEDPKPMAVFKAELRKIEPQATGAAITYAYFAVQMNQSLLQSGLWAIGIVLILVIIDLRRARDVVLVFVPLVMGGIWMVGLMNVLGIEYNFSNVLAIPLIVGLGIDSGLHVVHRYNECGRVGLTVATTGRAVVVSALTTIGAFGVLVFAQNRGTAALGATLAIGVTACMILATLMLPALLSRLDKRP